MSFAQWLMCNHCTCMLVAIERAQIFNPHVANRHDGVHSSQDAVGSALSKTRCYDVARNRLTSHYSADCCCICCAAISEQMLPALLVLQDSVCTLHAFHEKHNASDPWQMRARSRQTIGDVTGLNTGAI